MTAGTGDGVVAVITAFGSEAVGSRSVTRLPPPPVEAGASGVPPLEGATRATSGVAGVVAIGAVAAVAPGAALDVSSRGDEDGVPSCESGMGRGSGSRAVLLAVTEGAGTERAEVRSGAAAGFASVTFDAGGLSFNSGVAALLTSSAGGTRVAVSGSAFFRFDDAGELCATSDVAVLLVSSGGGTRVAASGEDCCAADAPAGSPVTCPPGRSRTMSIHGMAVARIAAAIMSRRASFPAALRERAIVGCAGAVQVKSESDVRGLTSCA